MQVAVAFLKVMLLCMLMSIALRLLRNRCHVLCVQNGTAATASTAPYTSAKSQGTYTHTTALLTHGIAFWPYALVQ
jgi:hypothetical protein